MLPIIPSTRFAAFMGDAEHLAHMLIQRPRVIGAHRATLLLNLAQTNKLGRFALQMCAREAGRHVIHTPHGLGQLDRVFNKASNKRLAQWAQDRNSKV
jgi:hypothetical protein